MYGEAEIKPLDYKTGAKVKIPAVLNLSGSLWFNGDDFAYGGGVSSSSLWKNFPCEIKAGNLVLSGAGSFMNNPLLSTSISPFSTPSKNISVLSAKLPDGSSFSRPKSAYVSAAYTEKNGFLRYAGLSGFYSGKNDICFSAQVRTNPREKIYASVLAAFDVSDYESRTSDFWYSENYLFKTEYPVYSALIQSGLKIGKYNGVFSDVIYLNPLKSAAHVFRLDSIFQNGSISLSYNPFHGVITTSGKNLDECLSIKINLQNQTKIKSKIPFFWKYGITTLGQMNFSETEDLFKVSLGSRFFCTLCSFNISTNGEFSILYTDSDKNNELFSSDSIRILFKKISAGSSLVFYSEYFQPSLKSSFYLEPDENYKKWKSGESVGLTFFISTNPSVNFSADAEFVQKDSKFAYGGIDLGLGIKHKTRFIDVQGKITLSIEY